MSDQIDVEAVATQLAVLGYEVPAEDIRLIHKVYAALVAGLRQHEDGELADHEPWPIWFPFEALAE
jgi:hypothetical protein